MKKNFLLTRAGSVFCRTVCVCGSLISSARLHSICYYCACEKVGWMNGTAGLQPVPCSSNLICSSPAWSLQDVRAC